MSNILSCLPPAKSVRKVSLILDDNTGKIKKVQKFSKNFAFTPYKMDKV